MTLRTALLLIAAVLILCETAGAWQHPLDPLEAGEYRALLDALTEAGHWDDESFLALVHLDEPEKALVTGWRKGEPAPRRAFAVVKKGSATFEAVVDVAGGEVVSWTAVPGVQPGVLLTEEWEAAEEIVRAHDGWRAAVAERGVEDPAEVVVVPLTAGYFGAPLEGTERVMKVLSFDGRGVSNFWGRPLEGLVAVVSLDRRQVVDLIDEGPVPIPGGPVDFETPPAESPAAGAGLAGFETEGHLVRWGAWSFHWRIDPRRALVLSLVRFGAESESRSVLYQASLSEMFVPYADPAPGWYFRAYMDAGEYGLGRLSSRLVPGLDCPPGAAFLNPWFVDEWGNPYIHDRAGCMFERATGDLAWKHFESVSGRTAGRPATEFVVRTVPAIGNYDYQLDWIFRPDGSIRVEVGATGVVQVKATRARGPLAEGSETEGRYGRWVAEHAVAVHHDHFFSYRLDFDVDGPANSLRVDRPRPIELEEGSPRTSSWAVDGTIAATEREAQLDLDLARPALWRVINPAARNRIGYPVSYQLVPGRNSVSLFDPGDFVRRRAGFTGHHLWVTPYQRHERYAAGSYPNQSRGGDGLPSWTAADRPIRDTDIVLWYTLGMRHVVRAEDWPVMPTRRSGFELRPFDFFDRNPMIQALEATGTATRVEDFGPLLDFRDPEGTEERLRALLPAAKEHGDAGYLAELLTQIARTYSRRGDFDEAHRILDGVEPMLSDEFPQARIRYRLERGRTFNLTESGSAEGRALFLRAFELARETGNEDLTIDAAHMMAMAEPGFEEQLEWTLKALSVAEGASDPKAKKWVGSLTNNLGWTYFDREDYDNALVYFERALAFQRQGGEPPRVLPARWNVGRVYRALGRYDEALALQEELLSEYESRGLPVYGYVYEELAELLHRQGDPRARGFFRKAYEALSDDVWMVNSQAERLARLEELGRGSGE